MNTETGVIYFRLNDRYDGDTTKNCSLTGGEIDKNFHFLRGNDIEKGLWNPETKMLILERVNGEKIAIALPIDGSGTTEAISFEGSEFLPESGGTLSLVANGGEPYLITGFTESCTELIETLNELNEKVDVIGNEITILTEEYDENFVRIFKFIDEDAQNEFNAIRKLIDDGICDLRRALATEIQNRKNAENTLREGVAETVQNLTTEVEDVERNTSVSIQNLSQGIGNITRRENEQDERIQKIANDLTSTHNELSEAIARETRNRKESVRNLRENVYGKLGQLENRLSALSRNCAATFENIENRIQEIFTHEQEQDERLTALNAKIDDGLCNVNERISEEKRERVRGDRQLSELITEKESELAELIRRETRTRQSTDETLRGLINDKDQERRRDIRRIENLVQTEKNNRIEGDNNVKATISIQRNEIERLISEEKRARQYQDDLIKREIANEIIAVGTDIEAVKAYARWLYYGSAENLLLPCDERQWGIAIRDITEGEYAGRREIYLNLNPNDKFLSQDCNYLASYITLKFNRDNNHIELIGKNGIVASYIDANIFIQKGFLTRAYYDSDNNELVFAWDSGDRTRIPATDIFNPLEGDGIVISGQTFAVSIGEGERFLTFRNGALITTGITDAIDTSTANLRQNLETLISREIAIINTKISNINGSISEIESTMVTNDEFVSYTASTNQTLSELSQNILNLGIRVNEQIAELRNYVDGSVSGISANISEILQNIGELTTTLSNLSDEFTTYTANTKPEIDSLKQDVFEATEEIDVLKEDVSFLTENVDTLQENLAAQGEHINEIDTTVSGLSRDVSKNSQDIDTLFEIIESGGSDFVTDIVSRDGSVSVEDEGGGVVNIEVASAPLELVSRDDSIKIEEESGGTVNIEVASAPLELVSRDDSIKIEEESGGTVNIEVNSVPAKITSSDDSLNVSEESGVTNIVIFQILNPEISIL